jgi:type IV fimbrial biogenesis protein FimT
MNKETGFTLIELMIVIAVIAIAGGIGAVSLSKYAPDYRLYSAARELQSTLQQARLLAVKRRVPVAVSFDVVTNTFQVFTDDGVTPGVLDVTETVLKRVGSSPGVDLLAPVPGAIQFNPRGFLPLGFPGAGVDECHFKNTLNNFRGVKITMAGNSKIIKSGDGGASYQ